MTTNQIAYFKAKIEERHYNNLDAENQRHNLRTEALTSEAQAETQRSNLVREAQNQQSLLEVQRHNQVTEAQTWQNLALTEQYNASVIALNEATTTLRKLESEQKALDVYLDQKYKEYERVFGSGSGKSTGFSTVGTALKVVDYVTQGPYAGVPGKPDHTPLKDVPRTKKVTAQQYMKITDTRFKNTVNSASKTKSSVFNPIKLVQVGYH